MRHRDIFGRQKLREKADLSKQKGKEGPLNLVPNLPRGLHSEPGSEGTGGGRGVERGRDRYRTTDSRSAQRKSVGVRG